MHVEKPKVYFKLGDYDDNIIDELYVGPGFRAKIVKRVKNRLTEIEGGTNRGVRSSWRLRREESRRGSSEFRGSEVNLTTPQRIESLTVAPSCESPERIAIRDFLVFCGMDGSQDELLRRYATFPSRR